jgi:hypothetical protein
MVPAVVAVTAYLWAAICVLMAPLRAQTPYGGVLERIEVTRTSDCAGAAVDVYAAAPTLTVTHTNDCSGSSTVLELNVSFPLATPGARQSLQEAVAGVLQFDSGLMTGFSAKATYYHGNSSGSKLWWTFPAAEAGCPAAVRSQGPSAGVWTATVNAECVRNRKQELTRDAVDGALYFTPWAEVRSELWPGLGSTGGVVNRFGLQARAWYRMLRVASDNSAIAIATPAPGQRQDPNGFMKAVQAEATYELGSADSAAVLLIAEDEGGNQLSASLPVQVVRGKGRAALALAPFRFSPYIREIAVTARLVDAASGKVLSKSEPARYPVQVELRVDHVEVLQVVQGADNNIPLAANRATWLRLFGVAKELESYLDGVEWQARAFREGRELEGSPMTVGPMGASIGLEVRRLEEEGLSVRIPQSWTAAGTVELRVEINPAGTRQLNETQSGDNKHTQKVTFQERPPLHIRQRLVCVEPRGEGEACPWGGHDGVKLQHVLGLFPVQEDRASYEAIPVPPLKWRASMESADSWERLMQELALLDDLSPGYAATHQQVIGWLPAAAGSGAWKRFPLPVANGGTGRVVLAAERSGEETEESESMGLAHEVAHNLGVGHAYPLPECSDTAPGLTTGEYNQYFGALLAPWTFHLMSRCGEAAGLTAAQYRTLWQGGFQAAGGGRAQGGRCLLVQGRVWRGAVRGRLDRVLPVDCGTAPAESAGSSYCLLFGDQFSQQIGKWCFPVSFILPETKELLEERSFYVKAPMPEGLWRVSLLSSNQEVATRRASSKAPVVQFVEPRGGERWMGGAVDLVWSGSDGDGDSLVYVLSYSFNDGATWIPIAADLTGTRYSLELRHIQGGARVRFRVTASDGLLAATADSGVVEVVQGPLIQVGLETLEFPMTLAGRERVMRVGVGNSGDGPLNIRAITVTGAFRVKEAAPVRIAAGVTRWITVEFVPRGGGVFPGTLTVMSDDVSRPVVEVMLVGVGGG